MQWQTLTGTSDTYSLPGTIRTVQYSTSGSALDSSRLPEGGKVVSPRAFLAYQERERTEQIYFLYPRSSVAGIEARRWTVRTYIRMRKYLY